MEALTSTTMSLVILRPLFSELAKNLNGFLSREFSKRWATKNFSINNEQLVESINKIGLVKTLYTGAERPVDIHTFFYLPSVTIQNNVTKINSIDEIDIHHHILLEATVGQGKSILMRYLALQEVHKNRIPIFIELKNITTDKNLIYLIKEKFIPWTGDITDEQIRFLLSSGKTSLFLDAFDEISKDFIIDTISTIEHLASSYNGLKLIISSRPHHDIKSSNYFESITVNPYDQHDQKNLIEKLVDEEDSRKILLESIENSTPEIQEILTTPLMIGLYIKKFNIDFAPPENITSFYRNIFEVVAVTHDRTKSGFIRKSLSGLNQSELERIFERFCFECYKKDKTSFEKSEILDLLNTSITRINISNCISYNILDDFCNYLCLILRDGTNYTFIHRSIFEYYTAYFFSKLNKENAQKIIPQISNLTIILFLKTLNPYYFNKFYLKEKLTNFIDNYLGTYEYNTKYSIPQKFLNLFYLKDYDGKNTLYLHSDFLDYRSSSPYLHNSIISPIAFYIAKQFTSANVWRCSSHMPKQPLTSETTTLYQQMNVELELKKKIENIIKTYNQCLIEISNKDNEITSEDFDDI